MYEKNDVLLRKADQDEISASSLRNVTEFIVSYDPNIARIRVGYDAEADAPVIVFQTHNKGRGGGNLERLFRKYKTGTNYAFKPIDDRMTGGAGETTITEPEAARLDQAMKSMDWSPAGRNQVLAAVNEVGQSSSHGGDNDFQGRPAAGKKGFIRA